MTTRTILATARRLRAAMSSLETSSERCQELAQSLAEIQDRARIAASSDAPTLVAVSKYKPASDILACYRLGQRDFGENYVQELVDKAGQLPDDIRWHFIGTLQSNKCKTLASIPNIYAVQTVASAKAATALNKSVPSERNPPLYIFLQVNTSGEDVKSGLPPLTSVESASESELVRLAEHVVTACPRLHLQGLMTIGSLGESLASSERGNQDFETLKRTRDVLHDVLRGSSGEWGMDGRLLLSMGMSSDFEAALKAGSDVVRVGTGIFGARVQKA
ncbi:hypothetical protein BKA83DRAFT_4315785 [Pisolithus microcarpus]|nr:hypothetical protein BKA83DRAFT_4315785 [Pisolithus microcarpus]